MMCRDNPEKSPWMCHVCDYTSDSTEPIACALCYKIACSSHIVHKTVLNEESGLYELQPICVDCSIKPYL